MSREDDLETPKPKRIKTVEGELAKINKISLDPVYGLQITIPGVCVAIMDTPQFQRLRKLKQLGLCYLVYSGACHNRFEHSLGVCHLAGRQIEHLRKAQPELGISNADQLVVQIAALCHDLGELLTRMGMSWTHEEGSITMLDHLIKVNKINLATYGLDPVADLAIIKEMILGCSTEEMERRDRNHSWPRKRFLYHIVNNKESGLDVDKLDYYRRDCRYSGISIRDVYDNLIDSSRVMICDDDGVQLYQHRVVKALEYMMIDALVPAMTIFTYKGTEGARVVVKDVPRDPVAFTRMNDSIMDLIQNDDTPELEISRQIFEKIEKREMYTSCGRVNMPEDLLERIETAKEKHEEDPEEQLYTETDVANEIVAMQQSNNGLAFTADDIIVEFVKVHHGKGDQNPVNSVYFFKKEGGTAKTIDTDTKLHATLPRSFIDRCIRVFSKKSDYNRIVNAAFAEWSSEQKGA
eukprot:gene4671-33948_t